MSQKIIELEVKVLEIDAKQIEYKLIALGADKVLDTITYITFFDTNFNIVEERLNPKYSELINEVILFTSNGSNLRAQNIFLRSRKQGEKFELTLKHSSNTSSSVKSDFELNYLLNLSEWSEIVEDLLKAGFIVVAKHEKKRKSYEYKTMNLHFDIDQFPGIPTYLEIEGQSEHDIFEAIKILSLEDHEVSLASGEKFFKKYGVEFYSSLTF